MDDSALYQALGTALQNQPDVNNQDEFYRWLGRANALAQAEDSSFERELSAHQTVYLTIDPFKLLQVANAVLCKALARVEIRLPVQQSGSFIQAGSDLDALASVSRVLKSATKTVFLIDPYMDATLLTDFSVLVDENISVRLLTDKRTVNASFKPAVTRFKSQFGASRTLEARITPPSQLHDRLIFIDENVAFSVTQSFKDLAKRSHASIIKIDPELSALKVAAYEALWSAAKAVE